MVSNVDDRPGFQQLGAPKTERKRFSVMEEGKKMN